MLMDMRSHRCRAIPVSLFDLTNRVIIVTGSRGFLGHPICAALAEAGAVVMGIDLTLGSPTIYRADIRSRSDLDNVLVLMREFERVGDPDGLVLLHGIDAKPGTDDADPWRSWQAMLDVNLTGTMNACKVFGSAMAESGRGSIVTVGSLYAHCSPDPGLYDNGFTKPIGYTASKHSVLGLTRHLAAMWGSAGVRVNCISPGGIGSESTPPGFRERFEERVPLGRMGTPGDLVGAIQFLLSDASAYITGQEIRCDGGVGLWP